MSSDPAFNLAAQLLAADLNVKAGARTCPSAITAINDAQTVLAAVHFNAITHDKLNAAQTAQANSLATTLDRYNNNLLCQQESENGRRELAAKRGVMARVKFEALR
jgi:hypothetical protein